MFEPADVDRAEVEGQVVSDPPTEPADVDRAEVKEQIVSNPPAEPRKPNTNTCLNPPTSTAPRWRDRSSAILPLNLLNPIYI